MDIKTILTQSLEYKFASQLPEFSDSSLKTKLWNVAKRYNALYSDTGWEHIQSLQKDLKHILPNLSVYKNYYDNKMPNESKTWVLLGAFNNPKLKSVWIQIKASGAGSIEDPLSRFDITTQIEILAPRNLDADLERFFNEIVE